MLPDDIGIRLREAREYVNLSQQEVSDKTGIPRPSISAIENGKRGVDVSELERLASAFGLPASYFLSDTSTDEQPPEMRALFRATSKLSDDDVQEVLRFAEYLRFRKKSP
jgi:transcriptional regulator with XRE-family HTH domain